VEDFEGAVFLERKRQKLQSLQENCFRNLDAGNQGYDSSLPVAGEKRGSEELESPANETPALSG
jgi:hypothetical protein